MHQPPCPHRSVRWQVHSGNIKFIIQTKMETMMRANTILIANMNWKRNMNSIYIFIRQVFRAEYEPLCAMTTKFHLEKGTDKQSYEKSERTFFREISFLKKPQNFLKDSKICFCWTTSIKFWLKKSSFCRKKNDSQVKMCIFGTCNHEKINFPSIDKLVVIESD